MKKHKRNYKKFFYFNLNCIFAPAKTLRSKVKRRHEERVACGSFWSGSNIT